MRDVTEIIDRTWPQSLLTLLGLASRGLMIFPKGETGVDRRRMKVVNAVDKVKRCTECAAKK
jgi:hypothetical protein